MKLFVTMAPPLQECKQRFCLLRKVQNTVTYFERKIFAKFFNSNFFFQRTRFGYKKLFLQKDSKLDKR